MNEIEYRLKSTLSVSAVPQAEYVTMEGIISSTGAWNETIYKERYTYQL